MVDHADYIPLLGMDKLLCGSFGAHGLQHNVVSTYKGIDLFTAVIANGYLSSDKRTLE